MYGPDARKPGTFANTALMARRLVERGVRFVQVYHNNWDHHGNLAGRMPNQCRDVDQPCWALIQDLKREGLFDPTLVIWGGEFGRTIYSQGGLSKEELWPRPPSALLHDVDGGRRLKRRNHLWRDRRLQLQHRQDPVHIRDFHATVLHLLGIDHERFTYRFQGLDQRLTGVERRASSRRWWAEPDSSRARSPSSR